MADRDYRSSHRTAKSVSQYEAVYAPDTYDSWVWELEKAYLSRAVQRHLGGVQRNIRLLDFACGTGRVLAFLEPMVAEATGVDVSSAMLTVAAQRVGSARLLCVDITKGDVLPAAGYDLVTAFRFFLNAENLLREEALTAIHRIIADGGILIANVHANLWSMRFISYLLRRYFLKQRVNALSPWGMRRMLARHGFDVVEFVGLGWCSARMYQLLGRHLVDRIEQLLSRVPVFPYLAVDLLFVCRKADGGPG